MRSFPISILIVTILIGFPFSHALAAKFQAGETVTIPKDELISDNLYVAGGDVTIASAPLKDLVAAGGQLTLNAPVWGDALLAGGNVSVLEPVQGDLRVVGGQVKVIHTVRGDAVIAGGQVQILPGTTVSGDAVIAGGDVVMDGIVNGTTRIYAGSVRINGTVSGPLYIRAGESVSFGDKAVVKSQIIYSAPEEAVVSEGANLPSDVQFTQNPLSDEETKKNVMKGVFAVLSILLLLKFVTILVTALLVAVLFNKLSLVVASETLSRFWFMLLIGFLTVVVTPIAITTLMVTVVGLYIGLILMVLYALALLAAGIFLSITTGALLAKLIKKEIRVNWKWVLLGSVVVFVVALVPFIGWIAVALMYVASLGAVVMSMFRDAKTKV